jgi:hypothetical protein
LLSVKSLLAVSAETEVWPVIQPVRSEHTYVDSGRNDADTPFVLFIKNLGGLPAYKLECHNGNFDDESEINFSGNFHCALFAVAGGRRTSWNLLATDEPAEQKSDWFNRGRMTSNQLWGRCGANPEYGKTRHFRVRGMKITFEFKNVEWFPATKNNQRLLKKFTFNVSAVSDKSAKTPTAERVGTPRPTPPSPCS